jgi:hypothetical protein
MQSFAVVKKIWSKIDNLLEMQHDVTEKEKEVLKLLQNDLKALKEELKDTADTIIGEGYSKFPILIAHVQNLKIAEKIIDSGEHQSAYHFSASTLEDLVENGVVLEERKSDFEKQIQSNKGKYCVLLLHPDIMRFIFTPFK